ncbi:MAG: hypothetical protein KIT27_05855 [Legionellales bacterium]|nr:hypothetical protein [Legionellales bacterium]
MTQPRQLTLHGVFMDVLGLGILLTGESGIGKSELALGLLNRGHRMIADDAVIFTQQPTLELVGTCPPLLQDFLEVRGLGILNIRVMFGDTAIKDKKQLQLIIKIARFAQEQLHNIDRLYGIYCQQPLLDTVIPEITLPVAPGRNLAVLVECAVRNEVLKMTGYDAAEEFIQRQQQLNQNNSA